MVHKAFLLLLVVVGVSAKLRPDYVLKESRHHAPRSVAYFKDAGKANPTDEHKIVFAVHQNNLDELNRVFRSVSDPTSKTYGQYLSFDEVGALVANPQGTAAVVNWLASRGIKAVPHPHGDYVTATAAVARWNDVLQTDLHVHVPRDGRGAPVVRGTAVHVPRDVERHVSAVFHAVHLPHPVAPRAATAFAAAAAADGATTPATLNSYYSIASNDASAAGKAQSVYEALDQNYSPSDLAAFQAKYAVPARAVAKDFNAHNSSAECASNPNACGEANLDVQYLMAVAQGLDTWYWYSTDASFAAWIVAVAAQADPPLVQSISYGGYETETPSSHKAQFTTEAQKLGVQGVSVVVASGDDGVSNFQARSDPSQCGYHPSWPATSPFVTAVGATEGPETGKAVTTCSTANGAAAGYAAHPTLVTSGGGFSDAFAAPGYQAAAVANYLKTGPAPFGAGYNATGRGYPDVAMLGHGYSVALGGNFYLVDGTSAAAPVFAGVLSLVNGARLAAGKPPVGFANTALYQLAESCPAAFLDVTTGANNCCGYVQNAAPNCCANAGFHAAAGWDPATGLGGVNVAKLTACWAAL